MNAPGLIGTDYIFLSNCGVAPLCRPAYDAEINFAKAHHEQGSGLFATFGDPVAPFRRSAAELLKVRPSDISFIKSTAEGLNIIANGYPFAPGDEVITYAHEYPSNYYPWVLQAKLRGVVVKELSNFNALGPAFQNLPVAWDFAELRSLVTSKTRVIALSHVQFTSGFAADLTQLGTFCREKNIDLVIDPAQSLGCLPLLPESTGIAAIACSGWKWLLGPLGSGILYTSPQFRDKLGTTLSGPDMMRQGDDYLNHTWNEIQSGRRFEYSTTPFGLAQGLHAAIEVQLGLGSENIWNEVKRLQEIVREKLLPAVADLVSFPAPNRSGILAAKLKSADPAKLVKSLMARNIVVSARGGYLRIAPHFFVKDDQLLFAVESINELGRG